MGRMEWTPRNLQIIRQMTEDRYSVKKIAEHFGCSVSSIWNQKRLHNINYEEIGTTENEQFIIDNPKMTYRELSKVLGLSPSRVSSLKSRVGRKFGINFKRVSTPEDHAEIRRLRAEGYSIDKVCLITGWSRSVVNRYGKPQ